MSNTKRFVVTCECNSCRAEQDHLIDLSEEYEDDELREAIDEQAHDCYECGDQDWSPTGEVKEHGAA